MPGKNNKIQVDLDLLQDSAQKLEQFNRDFGNNVERLAGLLSAGAGGGTTGAIGGAGQVSPSASTSAQTDQLFTRLQSQGGTLLNAPTPPGAVSSNASVAGDVGLDNSLEQQMIRFQRRVGTGETAIPIGFRQGLGYYAEGELGLPNFGNFMSPPQYTNDQLASMSIGERQKAKSSQALFDESKWRYRASRANDLLFQTQAIKANVMLGMGKYTNFFGGVQSITNAGYSTDANANRSGHIPTPWGNIPTGGLFSGAMMHGMNESIWQPMKSSFFGMNPAYSMGDAQAARQAVNAYGWSSGNMGDWLANTLKENTVRNGIDPQSQMAFLDPMLRWGGNSFQEINTALQQIPSAATAAGYNLKQFTQELVSTATQVAQQTGIPIGTIASGISAISATTGLAPSQAGGMMNLNNILMASGTTGTPYYDIMFGHKSGALLARPLEIFQNLLHGQLQGHSMKQLARDFALGKQWALKAMGPIQMLYMQNPEMFNGMNPTQMMHMLAGGSIHGLVRQTNIQDGVTAALKGKANTAKNRLALDAHLEQMMSNYYPGNKARDQAMVQKYIKGLPGHDNMSERRTLALQLMRGYAAKDRRDQAKQTIGLTPDAKKLVQLMGNDPSHSNSGGVLGHTRQALGYAGDAAHYVGEVTSWIP